MICQKQNKCIDILCEFENKAQKGNDYIDYCSTKTALYYKSWELFKQRKNVTKVASYRKLRKRI